eukprot:364712-Chlamydomonas_euryale.AAC.6
MVFCCSLHRTLSCAISSIAATERSTPGDFPFLRGCSPPLGGVPSYGERSRLTTATLSRAAAAAKSAASRSCAAASSAVRCASCWRSAAML